jgi:hypothetical protein
MSLVPENMQNKHDNKNKFTNTTRIIIILQFRGVKPFKSLSKSQN